MSNAITASMEAPTLINCNLEEFLQSLETVQISPNAEVLETAQMVQCASRRNVRRNLQAREQKVKKRSAQEKCPRKTVKAAKIGIENNSNSASRINVTNPPDVIEEGILDGEDMMNAARDAFDWYIETNKTIRVLNVQEQLRLRMLRSLLLCCLEQYVLTHDCGLYDAFKIADSLYFLMQKYKIVSST